MRIRLIFPIIALIALSGCYHASITTGLEPSTTVIDQPWAMGFVYGLIPPPEVDASQTCVNGVAKVETKLSFLNQLAQGLTLGLISPMHITVTCAAGTAMNDSPNEQIITVPEEVTKEDVQQIYKYASDLAVRLEKPIYVKH